MDELIENIEMIKFEIPYSFWEELKDKNIISSNSPIKNSS